MPSLDEMWKDPVWATVIAGLIVAIIIGISGWIYRANIYNNIKKLINYLKNISIGRRKDLLPDDIIAIIDSWWPESTGMFPKDVSADFKAIEKEFRLPSGSVHKYIDIVASKRKYKRKTGGSNYATYEFDIDKVL